MRSYGILKTLIQPYDIHVAFVKSGFLKGKSCFRCKRFMQCKFFSESKSYNANFKIIITLISSETDCLYGL